MARYGQTFKDKAVSRLLPLESATVETVARELSISAATLARWRAEALSQPVGERGWSAGARFEAVKRQIERKGYIARGGQIVDATLVRAPRQHFSREEQEIVKQRAMPIGWSPAKRRQKDLDATWTKKHGKSHYGYKLSVCVDRKHKLIRRLKTDTASTHDSRHFEALLDQRKVKPHRPLSKRQSARNTRIARLCARVEHVFAAIEHMGGKMIRTIGRARADFALTLMAACYTLRRTVWLVKSGATPW